MTGYNPEGIRCWGCEHCWNLSDDMDYNDEMPEGENPQYDLGKHFEEVKHER